MRRLAGLLIALSVFLGATAARGQSQADAPKYRDVFYASGDLRIQAYLYKPEGDGPFPVVIYNHGTRDGRERESFPFPHIGRMLTQAGYVAWVPERRGYGKSDGRVWWQEAGGDQARVISRLQAETDDVFAGMEYLRTLPYVDTRRIALMGWSFGGVVTMLAAARSPAFLAAVNQAGGALAWDESGHMRSALVAAAEKSMTPTLFMVAKNDRTTSSVTTLADIFRRRELAHKLAIYEAFTPARPGGAAPGHALFSSQGVRLWENDVIEFLGRYVK